MSRSQSFPESNPLAQYPYLPDFHPWQTELTGSDGGLWSGSSTENLPSSCFPEGSYEFGNSLIERILSDCGPLENLALGTGSEYTQKGIQHSGPDLEEDALPLATRQEVLFTSDPYVFEVFHHGRTSGHSKPMTRTLSDRAIWSTFPAGKFNCSECRWGFDLSQELEEHARNSKHRAYVCPRLDCGKKFSRRDTFVRHTKGHTSTQQHKCSGCHKMFKRKDHLQQHTRKCLRSSSCEGGIGRGKSNVLQTYLPVDSPLRCQLSIPGMKQTLTKLLLTSPSRLSDKEKAECEENLVEDDLMLEWSAAEDESMRRNEVRHQYFLNIEDCNYGQVSLADNVQSKSAWADSRGAGSS